MAQTRHAQTRQAGVSDTSGLWRGDRVVITVGDVSAGAMFHSGVGQGKYVVQLDGTGQLVTVPGSTISREEKS